MRMRGGKPDRALFHRGLAARADLQGVCVLDRVGVSVLCPAIFAPFSTSSTSRQTSCRKPRLDPRVRGKQRLQRNSSRPCRPSASTSIGNWKPRPQNSRTRIATASSQCGRRFESGSVRSRRGSNGCRTRAAGTRARFTRRRTRSTKRGFSTRATNGVSCSSSMSSTNSASRNRPSKCSSGRVGGSRCSRLGSRSSRPRCATRTSSARSTAASRSSSSRLRNGKTSCETTASSRRSGSSGSSTQKPRNTKTPTARKALSEASFAITEPGTLLTDLTATPVSDREGNGGIWPAAGWEIVMLRDVRLTGGRIEVKWIERKKMEEE